MKNLKSYWHNPNVKFVVVFALVFLVSFSLLFVLGLVPKELRNSTSALDQLQMTTLQSVASNPAPTTIAPKIDGEEPVRVIIPSIKVNTLVLNPDTTDNVLLNEYLTKGAVRYPGSGLLGDGNVLIFGHSSNLSVVNNQAYKALNGVKNLVRGDTIYVDSSAHRYTYSVTKVSMVKASDEYINFDTKDSALTLSTCNTLGAKEDRYVVEAIFESKKDL